MEKILNEIGAEIDRAQSKLPEGYEDNNTLNDFIAYAIAYLGRASQGVFKNEQQNEAYRENMVKAAGLCISAIASFDKRVGN